MYCNVCCNVLQILQCMLLCIVVYRSVLQGVAVCCRVLQCDKCVTVCGVVYVAARIAVCVTVCVAVFAENIFY